ncbi:unnamed protein product [Brugia timori]|uniref:Transmembrane protein 242 n=1 Tax=Brugia timori TaxID=42155 RepID=A0A0R3QUA4_9BILA|nr:unnamed protein product [Brugia timori]
MDGASGSMGYSPIQQAECCTARNWLIGIGTLIGSALFGYYVGVHLSKKKARLNSKIKLFTDKVISMPAFFLNQVVTKCNWNTK